jgi:energy-coupling factor transporter ATP-binding protein EcfA2
MSSELLKFRKALDDRPLDSANPVDEQLYVNDLHLQQDGIDPIRLLADQMECDREFTAKTGASYLFTGQRGTGKTTELLRLKRLLTEKRGAQVFYLDIAEYLNLTTKVDIPDFLISVIGGFSEKVKASPLIDADPAYSGYWERIGHFLKSEIKLEGIEATVPTGAGVEIGLAAALRTDPSFKEELQKKTRGHVARMVADARAFVRDAVALIRKKTRRPDEQVVLIVDSFERIRGVGQSSEEVFASVHDLFSGQADNLKFPGLQIVYTIPPYLLAMAASLAAYYDGGAVYALSSVHLFESRSRTVSPAGRQQMTDIVGRRYLAWRNIIEEPLLERLAISSGGDIRDYFRMIQMCLMRAMQKDNTVSPALLDTTEAMLRRDMLPIAEEDLKWLKKIAATNDACLPSNSKLSTLARFFDGKLVLNYRNGEDWYDVHPLIRENVGLPDAAS